LLLARARLNSRLYLAGAVKRNLAEAGTALARVFLWPGDVTCSLIGLEGDDKRELVRMLVNSLIWILLGMFVAAPIT
jgi:hypothetical protein